MLCREPRRSAFLPFAVQLPREKDDTRSWSLVLRLLRETSLEIVLDDEGGAREAAVNPAKPVKGLHRILARMLAQMTSSSNSSFLECHSMRPLILVGPTNNVRSTDFSQHGRLADNTQPTPRSFTLPVLML